MIDGQTIQQAEACIANRLVAVSGTTKSNAARIARLILQDMLAARLIVMSASDARAKRIERHMTRQWRNLNDDEIAILRVLVEYPYDGDFSYLDFGQITTTVYEKLKIDLNRGRVRLACRSLKRKGLAKYGFGLWSEDGEPRGSGYAVTREGSEWVEARYQPLQMLSEWV